MGARSGGGAGMAHRLLTGGAYGQATGSMYNAFVSGDKTKQKKAIDRVTKIVSKMGYQQVQSNLNSISESISLQPAKPTHPLDKAAAKHNKALLKIYQGAIKKYL